MGAVLTKTPRCPDQEAVKRGQRSGVLMGTVLTKKPRCADQDASAKTYGLAQVEAGKRAQAEELCA
jgi:hypothetical protein